MSSKNKTINLGLNLWDGTDKPKRVDFNHDNETLDSVVGEHVNNTDIHITEEVLLKINSPFVIGTYIGDGASTRVIKLNFSPSFIFVFANNHAFSVYDKDADKVYSFSAAAGRSYSSSGIQMGENSFTVTESTGIATSGISYPRMNTASTRYQYIAFR